MAVILPRSVFIHVPKTGGTWCRAAIDAIGLPQFESGPGTDRWLTRSHASVTRAAPTIFQRNWLKKDTVRVERMTFGFVRDPWKWLASCWADTRHKYGSHDNPELKKVKHWLGSCFRAEFSDFIDQVLEHAPCVPSQVMLITLGYHRTDPTTWVAGDILVDEIGRNETLVDDFVRILKKAGEQFDAQRARAVPPQRVSGQQQQYKQQVVWTAAQRKAVYDSNRFLCDTFDYDLERY